MIEARRYLQGQIVEGRFPLIQYLGGTEHGGVFLTECADTENHRAAIKLIDAPPGNAQPQLTRWRLAARFSHPHLIRLFDAGRCTVENTPMLYVVMEYAEENLAEILTQRPLSPAETKEMLGPMLDALGYIHGKGFVHGHIQPSNILAIGDQLKLSSDRICRIGELGERRNGNARYCAPECVAGELTTAGDVWSLGVTLVECLTGRLPEPEERSRGTVSLPAELPAPYLELARHCLAKTPKRRWNVSNLKARLEAKAALAEVEEVDPPVARREETPSKQRYPLAWIGMGLALAAVLLVVLPKSASHKASPATHPAAIESPAAHAKVSSAKAKEEAPAQVQVQPQPSHSASPTISGLAEAAPLPAAAPPAPVKPAALPSPRAAVLARGEVLSRVLPDVLRSASATISGTVRVRVRVNVDPSGNVTGAQFDWPGPSRYFARLSMAAARQWKFRPPGVNAKSAASEWIIRFDYTNSAISATAVVLHP
ncbi:MAG: TonB family protein [Candidatus Acidiferrales bacterium]